MNRYLTLLFAAVVLATFTVPLQQGGGSGSAGANKGTRFATVPSVQRDRLDAEIFICSFVNRDRHDQAASQCSGIENAQPVPPPAGNSIHVLFATVPHPLETHLAANFDRNVDALIDGLQDSGYLYDSSWIPWDVHSARENYDDDQKENQARENEDTIPGVLLFRTQSAGATSYSSGAVVFLVTEKPTGGIAIAQVDSAIEIARKNSLFSESQVRILGPTFSGSFPSLVAMVKKLEDQQNAREFLIRSGTATVGDLALQAAQAIPNPGVTVNLGSAQHNASDSNGAAIHRLSQMGISQNEIVVLSESESAFGAAHEIHETKERGKSNETGRGPWQIQFPRDISSLRSTYEQQGILETNTPQEPWKRALTLKNQETSGGDTVKSFGGEETDASKESVLFGISEFLRSHGIRAVLISATNPEDRYFLTQFIHAHNSGIRIAVVGATRLFTRGSTAQFRGDLIVSDFPLLPRLHDWTAGIDPENPQAEFDARVFPDQDSQGVYFAAVDLMMSTSDRPDYTWKPEYSAPLWNGMVELRPPTYVVALGSNATWPVSEENSCDVSSPGDGGKCEWKAASPSNWQVNMPFVLFEHAHSSAPGQPPSHPPLHTGSSWIALFTGLLVALAFYCFCFWYADSLRRPVFASFEPLDGWRYWVCRVIVPGWAFSAAFLVMAMAADIGKAASSEALFWYWSSIVIAALAPCAVARTAWWKASGRKTPAAPRLRAALIATCAAAAMLALVAVFWRRTDTSSILNAYREMHWESGLSLIPTALLLLFALVVWCCQAGQGLAIFALEPPLPTVANERITSARSGSMIKVSRPFPVLGEARGLQIAWGVAVLAVLVIPFAYPVFTKVTTLEPHGGTIFLFVFAGAIAACILFDLLQFLWIWLQLKEMLRALAYQPFMRSFVPIEDFNWRSLWSFSGVSQTDRQKIMMSQAECVGKLVRQHQLNDLESTSVWIQNTFGKYSGKEFEKITPEDYAKDRCAFQQKMAEEGTKVAKMLENTHSTLLDHREEAPPPPAQVIVKCSCEEKDEPFRAEWEEVANLPPARKTAERFVCLLYIGFIQTVIARLHSLLISVAAMFSLGAVGIAIYPFAPVAPLFTAALVLFSLIALAFFTALHGMNKDPVMARIVNRDDRKVQWSFYAKFAESLALPLLTLASTLLPGGTARVLDLTRVLFSHGQ